MRENQNASVYIGQLNLRIPGNRAGMARRVASGVAQGLGQMVPARIDRRLGALSVRAQVRNYANVVETSDAVAAAIVRAIAK